MKYIYYHIALQVYWWITLNKYIVDPIRSKVPFFFLAISRVSCLGSQRELGEPFWWPDGTGNRDKKMNREGEK